MNKIKGLCACSLLYMFCYTLSFTYMNERLTYRFRCRLLAEYQIIAHSSAIAGTLTCQGVVLTLSQICHKFKMKVILKPKKLSILFMCIPSRVLGINLKDTQRRHEPIQSVYVTKDKYLYNITEVLYTL